MAQNQYLVRDLRGFLNRPRPRANLDSIRMAYHGQPGPVAGQQIQLPEVQNEQDGILRARLDAVLATLNQDDQALWRPVAPAQPAPAGAAQAAPAAAGANQQPAAGAAGNPPPPANPPGPQGPAGPAGVGGQVNLNWLIALAAVFAVAILGGLYLLWEVRSSNEGLGTQVASAAQSAKGAADSVATLSPKVDLIGSNVVAMATAVEENKTKVDGLSSRFEAVETKADEAKVAADEAKATAQQALDATRNGSNPGSDPTPNSTTPPTTGGIPDSDNGVETEVVVSSGMWGPAGPAPQTVAEAAKVMNISSDDMVFLTKLNPRAGDDTVIGWVLGTNASQDMGRQLAAGHLPDGTCVDFDPGASNVGGDVAKFQDFTPLWRRVLLSSDGDFTGLKMTVYWTPCNFTASKTVESVVSSQTGDPVEMPEIAPAEATSQCARDADAVAALFPGTEANQWQSIEGSGDTRWVYNGPNVNLTVPDGYTMDWDPRAAGKADETGHAVSGEQVSGVVFTLNGC